MLVMPFNRAESQLAASYVLHGKLPNRPDFVRVNANHPVALELDELIQRNLERHSQEAGWERSYKATEAVDFQYISRDRSHAMIGVLVPSQDQAGRHYPLLAAAVLPTESVDGHFPVSPIAYEVFFDGLREQMSNAIENSVEALSCRQFLDSHLRSSEGGAADLALAGSVVRRFMEQQPASRLGQLLAGSEGGGLQQALLNIAFYQAFLRRFDNPATNQVVVLPLTGNPGEHGLIASSWLSMLSVLWFGDHGAMPWRGSYLLVRRNGEPTRLVASVGRIPDRFFGAMVGGDIDPGMQLDLSTANPAWSSHRLYPEVSYALGRLLADPGCTLATLYDYLKDIGKQLQPVM